MTNTEMLEQMKSSSWTLMGLIKDRKYFIYYHLFQTDFLLIVFNCMKNMKTNYTCSINFPFIHIDFAHQDQTNPNYSALES